MQGEMTAQILLTLVSVGASTICAYLLYALQARDKRRAEEAKERERSEMAREEAREKERRELASKQAREYDALRKGVLAVLRDRIVQSAIHFHVQGCANVAQKDNISKMYEAYHDLGGNGTATHALKEVLDLPFEKEGR